jgi:hypothetical protein
MGKVAIRALALGAEGVECGEPAARGDFENRAAAIETTIGAVRVIIVPTARGRTIQVPIGGLDQVTVGVRAIGASAQGAEAVERGESATVQDGQSGGLGEQGARQKS